MADAKSASAATSEATTATSQNLTMDRVRRNTVGTIPMKWYEDYPHIGYDIEGKKIMKPAVGDELDKFLSKMDDPNFWRSVPDAAEGRNIVLTDAELDIVHRIHSSQYGDSTYNPYPETEEWFTSQKMVTPVQPSTSAPKSRFVTSKFEEQKIRKLAYAIRRGWILPRAPGARRADDPQVRFSDAWDESLQDPAKPLHHTHLPAPKIKLPGHGESYNPPEEYIDPEGTEKRADAPRKYAAMRLIPAYENAVKERYDRCLDLFLCPRARREHAVSEDIDPNSLLPKLPDPRELEPFPKALSAELTGHRGGVRCIDVDPTGQFLFSGSDDGSARLWDADSGRCLHVWRFDDPVVYVSANPNRGLSVVAMAAGRAVLLINYGAVAGGSAARPEITAHTAAALAGVLPPAGKSTPPATWRRPNAELCGAAGGTGGGAAWVLQHSRPVRHISWHRRGDFFTTVAPDANSKAVLVHQLSRRASQAPFSKSRGLVSTAFFHPNEPQLFVATQRHVRVYNLQTLVLVRKFMPGVKWISSTSMHSTGSHVLVGTYDKRLCWWDVQLGAQPYKTLRYHKKALRSVAFHPCLPLFASCSDDGTIQIFHGKVAPDGLSDTLIVPVKVIRAHESIETLGAFCISWHPTQPWLFSSGADGKIKIWV